MYDVKLKPKSGQEAFDILIDEVLGEQWYALDTGGDLNLVNAIALENILFIIKNEKEKLKKGALTLSIILFVLGIIIGIGIGLFMR